MDDTSEAVQVRDAIKQARALDKKAENARELGLDYEPPCKTGSQCTSKCQQCVVQEPVAYLCENAVGHKYFRWKKPSSTFKPIALYTTPPAAQRQWVGLTDKELEDIWFHAETGGAMLLRFAEAIEAKLKEKNNG